jgi:hypothetical protein
MKIKAILISFLIIGAFIFSFYLFTTQKIKDEGIRSIDMALDRLLGKDGFVAKKTSFTVNTRTYIAEDVTISLNNDRDPLFMAGPIHVDKVTIIEPLMPMALTSLSKSLDYSPSEDQKILINNLTLEGISFKPTIDNINYQLKIKSLIINPLKIEKAPQNNPKGAIGFLKNITLESLTINNLIITPSFTSPNTTYTNNNNTSKFDSLTLKTLTLNNLKAFQGKTPNIIGLKSLFSSFVAARREIYSFNLTSESVSLSVSHISGKLVPHESYAPLNPNNLDILESFSLVLLNSEDKVKPIADSSNASSPSNASCAISSSNLFKKDQNKESSSPPPLEILASKLIIQGASITSATLELLEFLKARESYDSLSSIPLSIILTSPFSFNTMGIEDITFNFMGEKIFSIDALRLIGPFVKGTLGFTQSIEVSNLLLNYESMAKEKLFIKELLMLEAKLLKEGKFKTEATIITENEDLKETLEEDEVESKAKTQEIEKKEAQIIAKGEKDAKKEETEDKKEDEEEKQETKSDDIQEWKISPSIPQGQSETDHTSIALSHAETTSLVKENTKPTEISLANTDLSQSSEVRYPVRENTIAEVFDPTLKDPQDVTLNNTENNAENSIENNTSVNATDKKEDINRNSENIENGKLTATDIGETEANITLDNALLTLIPQKPYELSFSIKALYLESNRSLILPEFIVNIDSLVSLEGNVVFLGIDTDLIKSLSLIPFMYPNSLLRERSVEDLSLGGFTFTIEDKGLAYRLLSILSEKEKTTLEKYLEKLKLGVSLVAAAKLSPLTDNYEVIESEIIDFVDAPHSIFLAFHPEKPLNLLNTYEEFLEPYLKDQANLRRQDFVDHFVGDSLSFAANGHDPVIILWRNIPLAFDNDINPTDSRYDGLGDLE